MRRELVGEPSPQLLSESASVAMYHVVQEALTNVRKYAGLNVNVEVREEWNSGTLSFTISDDGRGASAAMDGHKAGYGLLGMNERIEAVGGMVEAGPVSTAVSQCMLRCGHLRAAGRHRLGIAPAGKCDAHSNARRLLRRGSLGGKLGR